MKKKSIIITASILVFLLLAFRAMYTHFEGVKEEKQSYVHNLNFNFSAKVDSVQIKWKNTIIFFHNATGSFDRSTENKLNDQLKYNGDLKLTYLYSENTLAIIVHTADMCKPRDSMVVDTNNNKISFYRNKKVISESKVSDALNGRPF